MKAGEYKFDQPANVLEVRRRLIKGDVYARTVAIPEGYNIYDIAGVVEQAGLGAAADFITAAKGDLFLIRTSIRMPSRSKAISFPTPISSPASIRRTRS